MNSMLYEGCDKIKHNRSNLALQLSYVQKCALCHRVAQHPDHSMLIWQAATHCRARESRFAFNYLDDSMRKRSRSGTERPRTGSSSGQYDHRDEEELILVWANEVGERPVQCVCCRRRVVQRHADSVRLPGDLHTDVYICDGCAQPLELGMCLPQPT